MTEAKSIRPINPSKVLIVTGGRQSVKSENLASCRSRRAGSGRLITAAMSEGAKEASNFEHTWLIYKHPILIRPRAQVCWSAPTSATAEGTLFESALFRAKSAGRALGSAGLAPAGHISEMNVTDLLPSDDAHYEIASSKAGR